MNLSETDRQGIEARAARLEARTGIEIVTAVVGKCDAYPEIPWKAFALCSGLAFMVAMLWHPDAVLGGLTFLLGGAAAALATVFLPPFARLFLDAARREAEVRQYAAAFFLERDLSRTQRRSGILMLVGVFERSVVILPDAGVRIRLGAADLQDVIARMTPRLADGRIAPALRDGLDALEALLVAKGFADDNGADEIAQEVFEEKGA